MENTRYPRPFAQHGAEKMIYDRRMAPQAVLMDGIIAVCYQAGTDGPEGHPHVIGYNVEKQTWSAPVRVGTAEKYDHHYGPVLWADTKGILHLLYGCHFTPGHHLVCKNVRNLSSWTEAPTLSDSISYPSFYHTANGLLWLYRVEGHLGYWVYRTSPDGIIWSDEKRIIDFDRDAQDETDRWAGSYVGACMDRTGTRLYLGFCHWEERDNINPRYHFKIDLYSRYHLYFMSLDIASGTLRNLQGDVLPGPVNRREADACRVFDSGHELTNLPTVAVDPDNNPCLLVPVSDHDPFRCRFSFFRAGGSIWERSVFGITDNIWSDSILRTVGDVWTAVVVSGTGKGEEVFYGGGILQEWQSTDKGATWQHVHDLPTRGGWLYNNPKPVENAQGNCLDDYLVYYGWQGPEGIFALDPAKAVNRGEAYLRYKNEYL